MKIIHCLNHFLPDHIAGTEVYVSALCRELKLKGHVNKVLIPNYGSDSDAHYAVDGTEVIRYSEPTVVTRGIITGKKAPVGVSRFAEIISKENPDLVHFHELAGSNGISLFHMQAVRKAGFSILITFHIAKYSCITGTLMYKNKVACDGIIRPVRCSDCRMQNIGAGNSKGIFISAASRIFLAAGINALKWNNSLGTAIGFPFIIKKLKADLLWMQNNTSKFVVLTDWYNKVLLRNEIKKDHISVIRQALPNSPIQIKPAHAFSGELKIIFIGRINHFKGVDLLINSLKHAKTGKYSLDIFGKSTDEDYSNKCMALAQGMENVRWMGSLEPSEIVEKISGYDILCLPSAVCEMAPLVIEEAFKAGVPVIASDVYGNRERVVDGVNGWLFKFRDQQSLTDIFEMLWKRPQLLTAAKQHIQPVRDFKTVADEYEELYMDIHNAE